MSCKLFDEKGGLAIIFDILTPFPTPINADDYYYFIEEAELIYKAS